MLKPMPCGDKRRGEAQITKVQMAELSLIADYEEARLRKVEIETEKKAERIGDEEARQRLEDHERAAEDIRKRYRTAT